MMIPSVMVGETWHAPGEKHGHVLAVLSYLYPIYDTSCVWLCRKNPEHIKKFKHTKRPKKNNGKKSKGIVGGKFSVLTSVYMHVHVVKSIIYMDRDLFWHD